MNLKVKKIVTYGLTGLVALIFTASSINKLTSLSNEAFMASVGGSSNAVILAVMQLVFVALFLVPRTALLGTLFLIAYMGGAIAVHFVINDTFAVQIGIQTLIWVTAFVRFPELCKRICGCCGNSCQKS